MIVNFKDFVRDFKSYYGKGAIRVGNQVDMQEVMYDLYDSDDFEIDYDNEIIEIFS